MPHAIDDADWPLFRRLMRDYKSGRLNNKPPKPDEPRVGGGTRLRLGRTVEPIGQGQTGKIVRLRGKPGEEKPNGAEFEVFNRWGNLNKDIDVLWTVIRGKKQIVQSLC